MRLSHLYFVYGLCVMFYGMMAWFFFRKGSDRLSRLVMWLMIVLCAGCLKDVAFLHDYIADPFLSRVFSSTDMVAVPLYAFTLMELCRPGRLDMRLLWLHEAPFVILPVFFAVTRQSVFFGIETVWAGVYGFGYAVVTLVSIPQYHRSLRETFSYYENINLNWLRTILFSYFVILSLWLAECLLLDVSIDSVYLFVTLVMWMFVSYFIYRHESVIDELREYCPASVLQGADGVHAAEQPDCESLSDLGREIGRLFEEERIYLNPHLKLSDVAALACSNRTYVSRFFNGEHGTSFFEYVNRFRVRHAERLLLDTDDKIESIAERSGFNSRQSFHRVFVKAHGVTPDAFRANR